MSEYNRIDADRDVENIGENACAATAKSIRAKRETQVFIAVWEWEPHKHKQSKINDL
jgi:hypothetical protein